MSTDESREMLCSEAAVELESLVREGQHAVPRATWGLQRAALVAAGAGLLGVGLVATVALWPRATGPASPVLWPGFSTPKSSREGWADWARLDDEDAVAAAMKEATDLNYSDAAAAATETPSKHCMAMPKTINDRCSKGEAQQPDLKKICEEDSECWKLMVSLKNTCTKFFGSFVDSVFEQCTLAGSAGKKEAATEPSLQKTLAELKLLKQTKTHLTKLRSDLPEELQGEAWETPRSEARRRRPGKEKFDQINMDKEKEGGLTRL